MTAGDQPVAPTVLFFHFAHHKWWATRCSCSHVRMACTDLYGPFRAGISIYPVPWVAPTAIVVIPLRGIDEEGFSTQIPEELLFSTDRI